MSSKEATFDWAIVVPSPRVCDCNLIRMSNIVLLRRFGVTIRRKRDLDSLFRKDYKEGGDDHKGVPSHLVFSLKRLDLFRIPIPALNALQVQSHPDYTE